MPTIRILSVVFDAHLAPWELPRFRGAIAAKVGLEHEWFHNHNKETGGFHRRYPLIQYKIHTKGDQTQPMLLCIQEGIEEAHHFFSQPDWNIQLHATELPLQIGSLRLYEHPLDLQSQPLIFRIHKWRPFNPDNFTEWQQCHSLRERVALLDRILTAQIMAFADGMKWQVPDRIVAEVLDIHKQEWISFKDTKMLVFTLDFRCNVSLPNFVGIGKGVSTGFGVLRKQG